MSNDTKLLKEILLVLTEMKEEMELLRESQKPPGTSGVNAWERQEDWAKWRRHRQIGREGAKAEALAKQAADSAAKKAVEAQTTTLPAAPNKFILDANAHVDREAPAFLEVVS